MTLDFSSWLCASVLAVCVATAMPASAQSADVEAARAAFLEGNERFDKSDYPGALEAYQRADDIMRVPTTGYKVGKTLVALGRLLEAREKLLNVTLLPRGPNESPAFAHAREQAARLAEEVRARISSVAIDVSGPPDVEVSVDGERVDRALISAPLRLNPGRHVVRAEAPGHIASERVVSLGEGQHIRIHLALAADTPDAPREGPREGVREGGGISPLVWVGFGVAAAGVAVGSVTGVVSLKKAAKLEDRCAGGPCPADAQGDLDTAYATATASTIAFIAAGAGAAVGVVGLVLSDFDGSEPEVEARLGPGELAVRLRF